MTDTDRKAAAGYGDAFTPPLSWCGAPGTAFGAAIRLRADVFPQAVGADQVRGVFWAVVPAPRGGGALLLAPLARSTSMRAGLSAFAALAALRVAGVWGLVAAVVVLPAVWRMTKGNGLSAALPPGMGGPCFGHGRAVSPDRVGPAASGFAVSTPEEGRRR